MKSTEDGKKVPIAVTNQNRVDRKKRKKGGKGALKDNFRLFKNFFNIFK